MPAIAKLDATDSAVSGARIVSQVVGGTALLDEYPVARLCCDAGVLAIGEGLPECSAYSSRAGSAAHGVTLGTRRTDSYAR